VDTVLPHRLLERVGDVDVLQDRRDEPASHGIGRDDREQRAFIGKRERRRAAADDRERRPFAVR
jgi:hypothetical protein